MLNVQKLVTISEIAPMWYPTEPWQSIPIYHPSGILLLHLAKSEQFNSETLETLQNSILITHQLLLQQNRNCTQTNQLCTGRKRRTGIVQGPTVQVIKNTIKPLVRAERPVFDLPLPKYNPKLFSEAFVWRYSHLNVLHPNIALDSIMSFQFMGMYSHQNTNRIQPPTILLDVLKILSDWVEENCLNNGRRCTC